MDIKRIKCMFCSRGTTLHRIKAKKKVNDKIITLVNAPVHYCKDCKETFLSKEAQEVFEYVRSNGLEKRTIMFDFDQLYKEIEKVNP